MKKHLAVVLGAAALLAAIASSQEMPATAPTLDELVAKNVEAKGGAQAVHALQTLRRTEATLQGMTAVQAFDGKDGWQISPFQGRKDPERMSADDVKALMEDAEMDGPLVDWKEKGSTIEYVGREDVDGTNAYKIKVTRKNGDINFIYLDPDHFLEIRILTQRIQQGALVETETDLGDYEKIDGVLVPTSVDAGGKGDSDKQKIIIDKAEGNVPVDDAIFHFPTTPAK